MHFKLQEETEAKFGEIFDLIFELYLNLKVSTVGQSFGVVVVNRVFNGADLDVVVGRDEVGLVFLHAALQRAGSAAVLIVHRQDWILKIIAKYIIHNSDRPHSHILSQQ